MHSGFVAVVTVSKSASMRSFLYVLVVFHQADVRVDVTIVNMAFVKLEINIKYWI